MISIREKIKQDKRLLSHVINEPDTDFLIGLINHEAQTGDRTNTKEESTALYTRNDATQTDDSQVDMHIVHKLHDEVSSVMTTVGARVQDATLTAMESLMIPWVELAINVVNASSGRDADSVMPDPDQRDFSGNIKGLQMTASSRMNSNTDLNKIDETRGSW